MTPAACENRLGKVGLRGTLACWHSGLRAVAQVRVCSSQTRRALTSLGLSCLVWPGSLRPLTTLGLLWPLWALTSLGLVWPLFQGSDLAGSVVALWALTSLGLIWPSGL